MRRLNRKLLNITNSWFSTSAQSLGEIALVERFSLAPRRSDFELGSLIVVLSNLTPKNRRSLDFPPFVSTSMVEDQLGSFLAQKGEVSP
mmetsp:Transcript_15070/g.30603  ORF Transcript_15070/g.30603 Transcript_15070/m.30603 type:complete len:89 (-) Transcript_15070:2289-2555(-)